MGSVWRVMGEGGWGGKGGGGTFLKFTLKFNYWDFGIITNSILTIGILELSQYRDFGITGLRFRDYGIEISGLRDSISTGIQLLRFRGDFEIQGLRFWDY